ncbi:MAG: DUF1080 domain-containing protein [Planctomycetaceae bacterium]
MKNIIALMFDVSQRWRCLTATLLFLACAVGCSENAKTKPETPASAATQETKPSTEASAPKESAEQKIPLDKVSIDLTPEEISAGWISLFDGVSLWGWSPNSETKWSVSDGAIVAEAENPPGMLMTLVPFADYELRAEVKLAKGGNSGLFLRTVRNPKDPAVDCYELNVCDSHPAFPTGSLVARVKPDREVKGDDRWLPIEVRLEGARMVVKMDGEQVLDYTDDNAARRTSGLIGLQMNGGKVEFRKIALRPLGLASIWNGEDLTGWRVVPESKTEFTFADGELKGQGGLGFLETEQTWGNFVLQFAGKVNVKSDNSGIFFRSQAGTDAKAYNGYELQIQNDVTDGDLTKPANFGTGAIFRRVPARRVTAKDFEWFHSTLVAYDDQFLVWVNGELVTAWKDDRAADDNPRKGLRLTPGHLAIQAHDPTSDVSFRDLKVGELPTEP